MIKAIKWAIIGNLINFFILIIVVGGMLAALSGSNKNILVTNQVANNEDTNTNNDSNVSIDFKGNFKWAVPNYYSISSPFGWRIHPVLNTRSMHKGIDIPAPLRTKIYSSETGVVIFAGYNVAYGYQVLIDHGKGYISQYAHNSVILVEKGEKVKKGQLISLMGTTGWSTGSHLHFGIKKNGKWIDPAPILKR